MITFSNIGAQAPAGMGRKLLVAMVAAAVALGFSVTLSRPAHAAAFTFDVNTTADLPTSHGSFMGTCSTVAGSCSLRAAIDEANLDPTLTDTFTINIPTGNYVLSAANGQLTINGGGVTLTGAGPTKTIIDQGAVAAVFRVLEIGGGANPNTISGLTIQNGNMSGVGGGPGGGVLIDAGIVNMNAVSVLNNTADGHGGGIDNFGTLTMTNSLVDRNTASTDIGWGGGIADENTLLTARSTRGTSGRAGGGSVALSNVIVSNNVSVACGGGVAVFDQGTFTDVTFNSNQAAACGGGLYLDPGASFISVDRTTFSNNRALGTGGGALEVDGPGPNNVVNSTFNGNSATTNGGAMDIDSSVSLLNVTISGNTAPGGASIFGVATLKNTIVDSTSAISCAGAAKVSQGHNLDRGSSCGLVLAGDLQNLDPKLGPLASNGGLTQTMALLAGSPAIDKADNVGCPPTDQRGVTRPQNGICDIGAYEFGAAPPALPNTGTSARQPLAPWFWMAAGLPVVLLLGPGLAVRRRGRSRS